MRIRFYTRSKKAGASIWFEYSVGGKQYRESAHTADSKSAKTVAHKRYQETWEAWKLGVKPAVLWEDALVAYWKSREGQLITAAKVRSCLLWATTQLQGVDVAKIDGPMMERIKEARLGTPSRGKPRTSSPTTKHYMAAISSVLSYCVKQGWLQSNPGYDSRTLGSGIKHMSFATHEQADALVAFFAKHDPQLAPIVAFSFQTGLRQNNTLGLTWSHINLVNKTVLFQAHEHKAGHKTRKPLRIELTDDAVKILRKQLGKHTQWVFPYDGERLDKLNAWYWHKACVAVGLGDQFRWHDMRHTWASWHVQAGTSLQVLKELGGWGTIQMVDRYAHLAPSQVRAAVNNIARPARGLHLAGDATG